ncbi:hypothetical protein BGY98DRAFT_990841 [Russula aff. rugulosa BPL654]|nr:hypothetical protein BGY98DRAFT_990841 [Russula aff. rugulosa BPL654]
MSFGRLTSVPSMASTQIVAVLLLAASYQVPKLGAKTTGTDGVETCYGLNTAGIIGIAAAIILLSFLSLLLAIRRRRILRANLAQIQQLQAERGAASGPPQYPPATLNVTPAASESVTRVTAVTMQYYEPTK